MARRNPAELERRLRALASPDEQGHDLDRFSLFWLLTLGIALPAVVLAAGWFA
jgi:hypothetical protein